MQSLRMAVLCLVVAAAGCVECPDGLGLEDGSDAVFDPTLLGEWSHKKNNFGDRTIIRLERQAADSSEYVWVSDPGTPSEKRQAGYQLIQLGDAYFFDFPYECINEDGETIFSTHYILRVRRRGDWIALDLLDPKYIKEHPEAIRHTAGDLYKKSIKITATREELREYVQSVAEIDAAWGPPTTYRKGMPPAKTRATGKGG